MSVPRYFKLIGSLGLCLIQSCGSQSNPFAKKKHKPAPVIPMIELLSESKASDETVAVMIESSQDSPLLGAFLTEGQGEGQNLQLVDVQKPDTPFKVGAEIEGDIRKAIVEGDMLFVLDGAQSLSVYSLSDRANPKKVCLVDLPSAKEIIYDFTFIKESSRLYFSTELNGLQTVAVNLKDKTCIVESLSLPSSLKGPYNFLTSVGRNLALTDMRAGKVFLINLENPLKGDLASSYIPGGKIIRLKASNETLYVAAIESGLHKLEIRDITKPALLAHLRPDGIVRDVVDMGDHLLIAADAPNRELGIEVYKKQEDQSFKPLGRFVTPGITTALQLFDGVLYALDKREGKTILMILRLNL